MNALNEAGFPLFIRDTVARLARKTRDPDTDNVVIIHRDAGRYRSFVSAWWSEDKDDYVIGNSPSCSCDAELRLCRPFDVRKR
jgi:hypothetical protein